MIAEKVRSALGRELKRDPGTIEMHHLLRDDLGLNSLDAIELMFKVEEEFDLEIPDADLQKLKTVGDLVTYLETRLERSAPSSMGGSSAAAQAAPAPSSATDRPPAATSGPPPTPTGARATPGAASRPAKQSVKAPAAPKRTAKRRP